ncbi:L,D-transpeptidase family protein [Cohnella sp. REN36]|uniref:L,D-transpeptidase family protein n=1 Tax=Cohnella sp. REN36 TaxID=2887347 RepID=UPI001D13E434|nr:L,D-transpeptidase family protein [Cohnella sp. REN36]MCC3376303.1 L,D-transpeptidase family protein [Cohnella sp. REN36]
MNRRRLHKLIRIGVSVLFLLFWNSEDRRVFADPSLPIVADQGLYTIEVDPARHRLVLLMQGQVLRTYPVSVGNLSTPTPVGEYRIIFKGTNWGPSYGPRWLGLDVPWGVYGIHGTNKPHSIGQHMSHGCIRMFNRDVKELYKIVPLGTRVVILGHVLGGSMQEPRQLAEGDIGGDVQLIQSRLKSAGYYRGVCNGKFRSDTTEAVKKLQRELRLTANGVVSLRVYESLGLLE